VSETPLSLWLDRMEHRLRGRHQGEEVKTVRITVEEVPDRSDPVADEPPWRGHSSRRVFASKRRPGTLRPRRFRVECRSNGLRFLMDMSVRVSPLDLAVPLRIYAERRLRAALGAFESRVDAADIRVADVDDQHRGADKTCVITVDVQPSGRAVAEATDSNVYAAVDRAASRLRAALVQPL
jgi:putative sigma-54 modulation protein